MNEQRHEITLHPSPAQTVESLAAKTNMSVPAALSELVDNALDAGATAVSISHDRRRSRLAIEDDGDGMEHLGDLLTPYKRRDHESTVSGRFGIGGTASLYWLCEGDGAIRLESTYEGVGRLAELDLRSVRKRDHWGAAAGFVVPIKGTRIFLSGCRTIRSDSFRKLESRLAVDYAPALRRGVTIAIRTDDETFAVNPFTPPKAVATKTFRVVVGGREVSGSCSLVAPGTPNPIKGWAVEYGHRFVCVSREPAGDATLDFGRIYGEVKLPRDWPGINDHKNGFTEDPEELWEAIGAASREVVDRAVAEGGAIEMKAAIDDVNAILDEFTGYRPPVKGRRDSNGRDPEGDGVDPTGDGSPHERFSKVQPGDQPIRGRGVPQKIRWAFASQLDEPFQVDVASRTVRVLLSEDPTYGWRDYLAHPLMLARAILRTVATDIVIRGRDPYQLMFPEIEAQDVGQVYASLLRHRRTPETEPCAAT